MADVNRGNRPLSPHLSIYRPQITSALSILHRITGVAMTLGGFLVVWWFLAAATGPVYFDFVNGLLTSWIGTLVMLGSAWALAYHFCNGIRHLIWDMGYGFDLDTVQKSGIATVGASVLLLVVIIIAA